jgi:CBS domain-containing protein
MERAGVRRLPVEEGGSLVGMVSVGDLAVRGDARLAGEVMETTGPEA